MDSSQQNNAACVEADGWIATRVGPGQRERARGRMRFLHPRQELPWCPKREMDPMTAGISFIVRHVMRRVFHEAAGQAGVRMGHTHSWPPFSAIITTVECG